MIYLLIILHLHITHPGPILTGASWSARGKFMFERAHVSFGVCSKGMSKGKFWKKEFYTNALFKFFRVLQRKITLNALSIFDFSVPIDSPRFQRERSYLDINSRTVSFARYTTTGTREVCTCTWVLLLKIPKRIKRGKHAVMDFLFFQEHLL